MIICEDHYDCRECFVAADELLAAAEARHKQELVKVRTETYRAALEKAAEVAEFCAAGDDNADWQEGCRTCAEVIRAQMEEKA